MHSRRWVKYREKSFFYPVNKYPCVSSVTNWQRQNIRKPFRMLAQGFLKEEISFIYKFKFSFTANFLKVSQRIQNIYAKSWKKNWYNEASLRRTHFAVLWLFVLSRFHCIQWTWNIIRKYANWWKNLPICQNAKFAKRKVIGLSMPRFFFKAGTQTALFVCVKF